MKRRKLFSNPSKKSIQIGIGKAKEDWGDQRNEENISFSDL